MFLKTIIIVSTLVKQVHIIINVVNIIILIRIECKKKILFVLILKIEGNC
jgi:hypothetical protein